MDAYDYRGRRSRAAAPNPAPGDPRRPPLLRAKLLLPVLVLAGTLLGVFLIQPSGGGAGAEPPAALDIEPTLAPTATPTQPPPSPTPVSGETPPAAGTVETGPAGEVAGVQATPTATPDFAATAQCGAIQETVSDLSVAQTVGDVTVRATGAAVYPADYFTCILEATGGAEAEALAEAIADAERKGATHAVLIDLWLTNTGEGFAQLDLGRARAAVAGLNLPPVAVIGSSVDAVVTGGQGRSVTLVVTPMNTIGGTTGPITLTLEAPLVGGEPTAGKYQLFLPLP